MAIAPFKLGGATVKPGERRIVDLPLGFLSDHTRMHMTVNVMHGRRRGPVMFISAAIHGDEIIGVEIVRRLTELRQLRRLRGTLILVPVVNTFGFVGLSRHLPDRRDLNRTFPGSATGSLTAQLAHTFMTEIVEPADYGIDLHSGAVHRANLPQIRANLDDPIVADMARAFGASIMLNANLRDGSLRQASQEVGCNTLLYEAGEALRFDESSIRIGVKGVLGVMRHIGMLSKGRKSVPGPEPIWAKSSHWLRAPMGGVFRTQKVLGAQVENGELIGRVSDPLGTVNEDIIAHHAGVVIGRTNLPVVNRGDAVFHIARVDSLNDAGETVSAVELDAENDPLFDGMELV
jgi:predicted deacylase